MTSSALPSPALARRSFLGLGLGAGAALALAACGGATVAQTGSAGTSGTLKWGWALPTSWDPVFSSAGWDVHVLSLVYAGLTKLDESGKAVPALATGWTYSADGTSLTFTLRPGLVFEDGTPLDAAAVKKSLDRGRTEPKSLVAPQLTQVKQVLAPDAATVVIELASPDYQLPNLLAGKTGLVVNPKAFESDAAGLASKPAGAGPFSLVSYVQNSKAVLRRNPHYWDAASIGLENFEVYPLPDAATVVGGLQSGQFDVAQIPGSQVEAAKAAGLEVQEIPSLVVAVLDVNTTKAPFDNPDVVEALKYAIDREALVKTQLFGHGEANYQPFPKGYVGYDPGSADLFRYDPDKARALLAKAGHPDGVDLTLTTSAAQGLPEQLQAQLKEVGIRATIEVIPAAQATQIVYVQHSKALFTDQFAGRDSAAQAFQVLFGEQGLMNPGRSTPPELLAAVQQVSRTPLDSPEYPKALQAATALAVRTMPNVFLYSVPRLLARRKSVSPIPAFTVVQRFEGVKVA
ncbi:ABC transporter substrate-binding protein [Kitasatospora sp. NA04385]|uniref:ABC transporter substrate-binding protein n=1 Tax=Kitasatospora sp. NA04385 TaxID=2742135 RepID=UPI0015925F86|nr:ABC transporter substrate-binding protein [Kitasatospora sp. NA04385]QKW23283.1 ABC transporter substrate-binding protein [Kitasatospora sp. NA04385]